MKSKWLFIGADQRLSACKVFMERDGYECRHVQMDTYSDRLERELIHFKPQHIVFPILQMQGTIPVELLQHEPVLYTGVTSEKWRAPFQQANIPMESYLNEELYIWENAQITAEAFLKEFYEETGRTVGNQAFAVAGFGRVGKMVAETLRSTGGRVTILARSEAQLAEAKLRGFKIYSLEERFPLEGHYVVNTIPAKWFLVKEEQPLFIFDLASAPGCLTEAGTFEYYKILPGLPGKHFPIDAAIALKGALERINRR